MDRYVLLGVNSVGRLVPWSSTASGVLNTGSGGTGTDNSQAMFKGKAIIACGVDPNGLVVPILVDDSGTVQVV